MDTTRRAMEIKRLIRERDYTEAEREVRAWSADTPDGPARDAVALLGRLIARHRRDEEAARDDLIEEVSATLDIAAR